MTHNPKQVAAEQQKKPRLDLLEHRADVETARAMAMGAETYGLGNYRLSETRARTYGAAIKRHVGDWLAGEDCASDTGLSHLAHVAASVHVLYGAMEAGTFVDDRGPDRTRDEVVAPEETRNEPCPNLGVSPVRPTRGIRAHFRSRLQKVLTSPRGRRLPRSSQVRPG